MSGPGIAIVAGGSHQHELVWPLKFDLYLPARVQRKRN